MSDLQKDHHLRTDYDDEDVILFLGGVLIAGFVSGVISEVSSHYSSIFEEMPHPPIKNMQILFQI